MNYSLLCTVFSGSLSSRQLHILGRYPFHQHPASRASFIPLYFIFLTVQSKSFGLNFWPFPEELALVDYPCLPIFPQRGQTREPYLNHGWKFTAGNFQFHSISRPIVWMVCIINISIDFGFSGNFPLEIRIALVSFWLYCNIWWNGKPPWL